MDALLKTAIDHHQAGRLGDAERLYRELLAIDPNQPDALHFLGMIAHQVGRNDVSVELIGKAIHVHRTAPVYHHNLGVALFCLRRFDEALAAYDTAIALQPYFAEAHHGRADTLRDLGRFDDAIAAYSTAVGINPDRVEAHLNRGNALKYVGRLEESLAAYDRAISVKPDYVEAHSNRGAVLNDLGRREEAIAAYDQALFFKPDYADAHSNRGVALNELGRNAEAIAAHDEAIRIRPDNPKAHSNRLMALHYGKTNGVQAFLPYAREYGQRFDRLSPAAPFANRRDPLRRLRIGYVSPDFRRHPVGFLLVEILANHAPSEVEVFCYSNNALEDDLTARLRASASHWRNLAALSDDKAADLMRADGIDILVDLSGHTAGNRLPMFALRPAPVQVAWLGYFGTTGLAAMDYVLADRFVVPAGEEAFFTERVWRLPNSYLCFSVPDVTLPPAEPSDLDGRPVTFGSFNSHSKTSPTAIELWARVLGRVPGSRLLLKTRALGDVAARRRLRASFAAHGIPPERLLLEKDVPRAALLAAYRRLDIALDPTPYGGGVTTLEALWTGVPVVSLRGNTWVGRVSESILTAMGLPEFVAKTEAEYVDIAVQLATNAARRAALRTELRIKAEASSVFQASRFTRDLEAAYRSMWQGWCGWTSSRDGRRTQ
jgi:protein O-GlcNAc transferase